MSYKIGFVFFHRKCLVFHGLYYIYIDCRITIEKCITINYHLFKKKLVQNILLLKVSCMNVLDKFYNTVFVNIEHFIPPSFSTIDHKLYIKLKTCFLQRIGE